MYTFYNKNYDFKNMNEDVESIVNDLKIYTDGLVLALKNNKFNEANEYSKKVLPL